MSSPDRDIFASAETILAHAEADLVVSIALLIVEILLAAGLAAQSADPDRLAFWKYRTRQDP